MKAIDTVLSEIKNKKSYLSINSEHPFARGSAMLELYLMNFVAKRYVPNGH